MENFHGTVVMLNERGATLHPIAVIIIGDAFDVAHLGRVDMPGDHAVDSARTGFVRDDLFELRDELDGVLDLLALAYLLSDQ